MRPSQIFPLLPPPPTRRRRGWAAPFYFDFLFFVRVHILERKQFFSRQILCRTSSQVTINTNIYFRFHHSCKNAWNKSQTMWPVLKNSKKFHILRKKSGFTQLKRRFCFCRARYKFSLQLHGVLRETYARIFAFEAEKCRANRAFSAHSFPSKLRTTSTCDIEPSTVGKLFSLAFQRY